MSRYPIPLAGIKVSDLCILRDGPPPIEFTHLGFGEPETNSPATHPIPKNDGTYWHPYGWQP